MRPLYCLGLKYRHSILIVSLYNRLRADLRGPQPQANAVFGRAVVGGALAVRIPSRPPGPGALMPGGPLGRGGRGCGRAGSRRGEGSASSRRIRCSSWAVPIMSAAISLNTSTSDCSCVLPWHGLPGGRGTRLAAANARGAAQLSPSTSIQPSRCTHFAAAAAGRVADAGHLVACAPHTERRGYPARAAPAPARYWLPVHR